ncbi:MAG: FkbM family methyltransferase, partial [Bacteroidia bacterium]|nr:FkbM family methyltransferase [Bacteroidia bacterium]
MGKSLVKAFKWISNKFNENPLTKNNKLSAYYRYIKFNTEQIFFNEERVYPFLSHTKFYAKKGLSGIVPNIYFGLHEVEEMGFLLHYLIPSDIFLDIGANVGAYTILASGEKNCKSIAIEPIPETFNYLKKNIELNKLDQKVTLHNVGLSYKNDRLFFSNNKDSMNHVVPIKSNNSIEIEVFTANDLIKEPINYMK